MELVQNWDNQNQLAMSFEMRYNWAQIEQPELTNLKVPYSNTAENFFQNQSIFGYCLNQYNRKQDVIFISNKF